MTDPLCVFRENIRILQIRPMEVVPVSIMAEFRQYVSLHERIQLDGKV